MQYIFDYITKQQVLENDLINVAVSRNEVENLDLERMSRIFKTFEKCKKKAKQKMLLTFDGYDHLPDEIYEIKEIRIFVNKLFNIFPHMFYFLSNIDANNRLVLACLCDTTSFIRGEKKSLNDILLNGEEFNRLVLDYKIPMSIGSKISSNTINYGLSIKEKRKDIEEFVKNFLHKKVTITDHAQKANILEAYTLTSLNLWSALVKGIGIERIVPLIQLRSFVRDNYKFIDIAIKSNRFVTPIM